MTALESNPSAQWIAARAAALAGDPEPLEALCAARALDEPRLYEAVLLLAELGELERARRCAEAISAPELRARALRCFDDASPAREEPESGGADDEEEAWASVARGPDADAVLADAFLAWFGGRRDLYAQQWFDEARRRSGYRPVEQPLTRAVAQRHLAGRVTIGQYLLSPDGTCSFGVIDLDLDANALGAWRAARGAEATAADHPVLRRYAAALLRSAQALGLSLFAEDSGGRGVHLWLFCRPRRAARAVRAVLQAVVASVGAQPAEVGVELFPKQDRVGPRGLSSLVKLPLGVHQVTLRRCHLLGDDLVPIVDPRAALERLTACAPDAFDAVVGRRVIAFPAPELTAVPTAAAPSASPRSTLPELLRAIEVGAAEQRAARAVLDGCAALRTCVTEAYDRRQLAPEAARALTYTLGLLGREPATARDALVAAHASVKELERLQRGLPAPMGCTKIRALLGDRCDRCLAAGEPYPTPVLYALRTAPTTRSAPAFAGSSPPWEIEDPLTTIGASLRRIEDRLDRLEGTPSPTPDRESDTREDP